jgi:energy-coupling factor transporter ATP-binding protein EcfA2
LRRVGLDDRGTDKYKTYSLGMKQRLAIASALLGTPSLLILDEPANGLDPAGIKDMRGLLRSLNADGSTIFVSSHQLGQSESNAAYASVGQLGRAPQITQFGHNPDDQADGWVVDHIGGSARGYLANSSSCQRSGHHRHLRHDSDRARIFMQTVVYPGNVRNCRCEVHRLCALLITTVGLADACYRSSACARQTGRAA